MTVFRLRATPKGDAILPEGPPVTIAVGPDGDLQLHCEDDTTFDWVSDLISNRLFVEGSGFPLLQRNERGDLVRDPESRRYVITAYADFAAPADELLQALMDNLEATEQFRLERVTED